MVSSSFTVVPGSELNMKIPDWEHAEFENLGTTVEVIAEEGSIVVGEEEFSLKQFHFHLPSEHLDNGTSMAMEMHMVWQSEAANIAVVGVYIDIDDTETAAKSKYAYRVRNRKHKNVRNDVVPDKFERANASFKETAVVETEATASEILETVLGSVDQIPNLGDTLETPALAMSELVTLLAAGSFQS